MGRGFVSPRHEAQAVLSSLSEGAMRRREKRGRPSGRPACFSIVHGVDAAATGTGMSRFRSHDGTLTPHELATMQQAYEDACRKLGLDPSPADPSEHRHVRDRLAVAVLAAAKMGERDRAALTAFAIAFGLRNWHLPKR